jgi:hypothetical protein
LKKAENRDPAEFLPKALPEPVVFESNKTYIREVLATQVQLTADLDSFVPVDSLPRDHRYFRYQQAVNGNGLVPSERVIDDYIRAKGTDYRWEIQGPHPVSRLRQGAPATREEQMRQR